MAELPSASIIVGGRNVNPEDVESIASTTEGIRPGRAVAFGVEDERLGSQRVVLVCEPTEQLDEDARRDVERALRRRAVTEADVVLGDVHLAERGWIVKTSSGKLARTANRDKYLQQVARSS